MCKLFERLLEERKRLGLNQDQIAEVGGVAKRTYCNYESGDREPMSSFFTAIAAAGADVQYILTGIRSSIALGAEEQLLLERYRNSPQAIKDAALRVLLIGDIGSTQPKVVIHGDVGQQFDTQSAKTITINMPKKTK